MSRKGARMRSAKRRVEIRAEKGLAPVKRERKDPRPQESPPKGIGTAKEQDGEPRALDLMVEPLRAYMLAKPGCREEYPFGPQAMVFKVGGKMFGLLAWEEVPVYISLKCDPERSLELREQHVGISGAYHMNKRHWHSVAMDGSVELKLAMELMDHSYELVVASLPGRVQERLCGL